MSDTTTALPDFARNGINLASERLGARTLACSDDFFAPMERMLQDSEPVFIADKYDDHGKWMDGWESRRKRVPGHDWCIVQLGAPGTIRGVEIDTRHFTGNYPPQASVEGCLSTQAPSEASQWTQLLAPVPLTGNQRHFFTISSQSAFSHLRLNIHPDGGVARFRAFGRAVGEPDRGEIIDLAAALNGGRSVAWNDAHYGSPQYILFPGRGRDMGDGWETRRRREPGNDWIIVELGRPGEIERIIVDTAHFKGNYPDRCSIQGGTAAQLSEAEIVKSSDAWPFILEQQKLDMDREHVFTGDHVRRTGPVTHVRLNIYPDGGVSRLRLFGKVAAGRKAPQS